MERQINKINKNIEILEHRVNNVEGKMNVIENTIITLTNNTNKYMEIGNKLLEKFEIFQNSIQSNLNKEKYKYQSLNTNTKMKQKIINQTPKKLKII